LDADSFYREIDSIDLIESSLGLGMSDDITDDPMSVGMLFYKTMVEHLYSLSEGFVCYQDSVG
jgi:hypothetical protein